MRGSRWTRFEATTRLAMVGYQRFFSKNLFGLTALLPSTALGLRQPYFFASKLGKNTIDLITIKKCKHEIDFEY